MWVLISKIKLRKVVFKYGKRVSQMSCYYFYSTILKNSLITAGIKLNLIKKRSKAVSYVRRKQAVRLTEVE